MILGSIFNNVRDKRPVAMPSVCFSDLVMALVEEASDADPSTKTEQTCISPATYPEGSGRSKANAISWNWFAADIDNKSGNLLGSSIYDMKEVMRSLGSPWFIYTTASSRPDAECFRLMFPLDRAIVNAEFDAVWQSFAQLIPMDPQTKDISRLFIVPRKWNLGDNRIEYELSGSPVSVDDVVASFPIDRHVTQNRSVEKATSVCNIKRSIAPSLKAAYVPQSALDNAMAAPKGGRMYRFLVAVAFCALRKGIQIDAYDLEIVGLELAQLLGRDRSDIRRDAKSAYQFAVVSYAEDRAMRFERIQSAIRPKLIIKRPMT